MEIIYLLNSGFMIRDEQTLLVFDDYEDPEKVVDRAVKKGNFEHLYIFASHAHFDHFDTHIRAYSDQVTRYIFSTDIKRTKRAKIFPAENIVYMRKYSDWRDENIKIYTYDSTDVGVSFLVETNSGARIFHAGDFNWWHWEGDTEENKNLAKRIFLKQLKRMKGLEVDVAFFPVDGRLGDSQELGVTEFLKNVETKSLVAMHRVGYPAWIPSYKFKLEIVEPLPIWSPVEPGAKRFFVDNKFLEQKG
ncbi:MAG: MBL fold metallo-hydrolase [Selenomonadaceae bacterium]|nr:MBL fold metallo-hydrolase [Selenomonadaceae bacterium]